MNKLRSDVFRGFSQPVHVNIREGTAIVPRPIPSKFLPRSPHHRCCTVCSILTST